MNTRLENRKVVEKLLAPAIEEVSISPTIITTITDGPIDLSWVHALNELDRWSKLVDAKSKGAHKISATSDVKPMLDDLINKVPRKLYDLALDDNILSGFGAHPRLLRIPDQGPTISQHQRSNHSATIVSPIQGSVRLPGSASSNAGRGDWTGVHQYNAVVLSKQLLSIQASTGEDFALCRRQERCHWFGPERAAR